jgi:actin-like ATPase involved in cell morphogenesis
VAFSVGVDIGSTYTAASIWRDGSVQSVPLGNRSNAVPSVLFLRDDGVLLVGEAASRRAVVEPDRQARDFKRRLGDDVPILLGDDRAMPAHELTGHLLRWVLDRVTEREGERPAHLTLTHPADWGDYRRRLLVEAAATADFHDVGLLVEPVAAAAWYAVQSRVEPGALVGVYDLGGGTFDASVIRKTGTGFEVVGEPGGDDSIGGLNFDHLLLRYVAAAAGVDLATLDDTDPAVASALAAFRDAVVDAKEALSTDVEAVLPVLFPGLAGHVTITRTHLESLIRPQLLGTVQLFAQVAARAGIEPDQLHAVLLVGGSSRIPLVSQLLQSELRVRVAVDAHPKYAVSLGAAITGAPRVSPMATTFALTPTLPAASPPPAAPVETPAPPWPVAPVPPRPGAPAPSTGPVTAPPARETGTEFEDEPTVGLSLLDLVGAGLTEAMDQTVEIPVLADVPRPVVTDRDEDVVVVRTGDPGAGYWGRGIRAALVVFLVIAVVVAAIVALTMHRPAPKPPSGSGGTGEPARSGGAGTGAASVRLTGQLVADPAGPDAMRAVAVLGSGDLVAVGVSVDLYPRAWLRRAAAWRAVPVPAGGKAAVTDLAAAGGRLLAVGWAQTPAGAQHPALWSSATGDSWTALSIPAELQAAGITELTAVTAAGSGFLATAVDRSVDSTDGDVAVFRSDNGVQWRRVKATGLDGPGPQEVHRLIQADGGFVAVGAALAGARRGPALWSSTDGARWQPALSTPPGSPTLWSVLRQPDGALLACGAVGPVQQPAPGCWTQRGGGTWEPLDVVPTEGTPTPLYLYDLADTGGGPVAVGAGRAGSDVDAGVWQLQR